VHLYVCLCAQLAIGYALPHLTLKSAIGLTNNPKVDIAATTGHQAFTVGASGVYDSSKGQITTWTAGLGYSGPDYQVGRHSVQPSL
jgi:voltage-dependent anion channel protein 2